MTKNLAKNTFKKLKNNLKSSKKQDLVMKLQGRLRN
jgi:hypothetical protein